GYHRLEILAALFNGLSLWLIVGIIFHAAYNRIASPPEIKSTGMLIVASVGLLVNITAAGILFTAHHTNLNVRGAFMHVVSDALGSLGAIAGALTIMATGWYAADPLVSIFIGVLILYTSSSLIKESMSILMQSVPKEIDLDEVQSAMERVRGVIKVHDFHVGEVTWGLFSLGAYAGGEGPNDFHQVLNNIEETLKAHFRIEHTTVQLEPEDRTKKEFQAF